MVGRAGKMFSFIRNKLLSRLISLSNTLSAFSYYITSPSLSIYKYKYTAYCIIYCSMLFFQCDLHELCLIVISSEHL